MLEKSYLASHAHLPILPGSWWLSAEGEPAFSVPVMFTAVCESTGIGVSSTVLVTNANFGVGIAAARALAMRGFDVVGCVTRRWPLGLASRYLRTTHVLDTRSQDGFANDLLALTKRLRPAALLPVGTSATAVVSRDIGTFSRFAAINLPTFNDFQLAYDKVLCTQACQQLAIPCPQSYSLAEGRAVLAYNAASSPLVVKPAYDVGGAGGIHYVNNIQALDHAVRVCRTSYGRVLIQEFIPGGPEDFKTAVLLFSRDSRLAAWFTMQKHHTWPIRGGVTAVGRSTDEFGLVAQVLPFFAQHGWRGPAEVEFKLDRRDGLYKVIEINPRFPGYLRFPQACGLDLIPLAVRLALGEGVVAPGDRAQYTVGTSYVNPGLLLRTAAAWVRHRPPSLGDLHRLATITGASLGSLLGLSEDPAAVLGILLQDLLALHPCHGEPPLSRWCWLPTVGSFLGDGPHEGSGIVGNPRIQNGDPDG